MEAVAPVEASAARSRRRQVNIDADEEADAGAGGTAGAGGVAGAASEQAASGGAAVRRARFQPSVERESDGSEDVGKDEQSDLSPQELVHVVRSKANAERSKISMIEISIPATRVNTVEDPPLQLLNVKANVFIAQVCAPDTLAVLHSILALFVV